MSNLKRKYQIGDEVDLRVRVVDTRAALWGTIEVYECEIDGERRTLAASLLDLGTLIERPLQVGDRVSYEDGLYEGELIALFNGLACVKYDRLNGEPLDDGAFLDTEVLNDLERIAA